MPLLPGKSFRSVAMNIDKLITEKPGKTRAKAIRTIAKKNGISTKEAKKRQAIAIAYSTAGLKRHA